MLLHVERSGIEESSDSIRSRYQNRHGFSQDIRYDCQEDYRDIDRLGFEVENLLKDSTEDGETNTCIILLAHLCVEYA
jgi:hypothetical protein